MVDANILGHTYDEAYASVEDSVSKLQRTISAAIFSMFPDRDYLTVQAGEAQHKLGAESVEVNVILDGKQLTIVAMPDGQVEVSIDDTDSLCVLVAGRNETLKIDNIQNSLIPKDHNAYKAWGSWIAAPIRVGGFAGGTICALEKKPRQWSPTDEALLEQVAERISDEVSRWSLEYRMRRASN